VVEMHVLRIVTPQGSRVPRSGPPPGCGRWFRSVSSLPGPPSGRPTPMSAGSG